MKTSGPVGPEEVMRLHYEAYNAHDVEAFLTTFSSDAKIYKYPDELTSTGHHELRSVYADFFEKNPLVRAKSLGRIVQGNYVLDHERVTGLSEGPEVRLAVIYEVIEGSIRTVRFIF